MNKLKMHFEEHKKSYILVGSGIAVGIAIGVVVSRAGAVNISVTGDGNSVVGKARSVQQVTLNFVERSTPSKPVHLLDSNLYFDSISDAARKLGLDRGNVSKHLSGQIDHVKGYKFEIV